MPRNTGGPRGFTLGIFRFRHRKACGRFGSWLTREPKNFGVSFLLFFLCSALLYFFATVLYLSTDYLRSEAQRPYAILFNSAGRRAGDGGMVPSGATKKKQSPHRQYGGCKTQTWMKGVQDSSMFLKDHSISEPAPHPQPIQLEPGGLISIRRWRILAGGWEKTNSE